MADNPVIWFEIYVENMERAKTFYETVFKRKLELLSTPPDFGMQMWSFPMNTEEAGAAGALVKMDGVSPGGNSTLVYFHCEDCAVETARVEKAGGRVEKEKTSLGGYGFMSLIIDTEGNMTGLHSMK